MLLVIIRAKNIYAHYMPSPDHRKNLLSNGIPT